MSVWKSGQSYKVSSKYLNWESLTLIMNYIPLKIEAEIKLKQKGTIEENKLKQRSIIPNLFLIKNKTFACWNKGDLLKQRWWEIDDFKKKLCDGNDMWLPA